MTRQLQADAVGPQRSIAFILTLAMLTAAFLLRSRYFGSPNIHVDEQFYLLGGDRLLHQGALPYVDIWDRKPVGLFLLYAAIRLLGGDGIIQYQIIASLFAGGTAALIALWGARVGGRTAGAVGGLFYLILLHKFSGFGGEAEVFGNLSTTAAAFIVCRQLATPSPKGQGLLVSGLAAMALSGLAVQIKQTAVFPGIFLGLALILLAWRSGWPILKITTAVLVWAAAALLPTVLVAGYYAATGHLDAFLFANVYSVGLRAPDEPETVLDRFRNQALGIGLPLGGVFAITYLTFRRNQLEDNHRRQLLFVLGWLAAGLIAFFSVGTFYKNYALILTPMVCLLLAKIARPQGLGWLAIAGAAAMSTQIMVADQKRVREQQAMTPELHHFATKVQANLNGRCLYVYRGLPIFYYLTNACLASPLAFPDHLDLRSEGTALPVDPVAEVRRILASNPGVIILNDVPPNDSRYNTVTGVLVKSALVRHYRLIAVTSGPVVFKAYALTARQSQPIPK